MITRQDKRVERMRIKLLKNVFKHKTMLIKLFELYEENINMQKMIEEEKLIGKSNILWLELLTDGEYLEKTTTLQTQMNWQNELETELFMWDNYDFISLFDTKFLWDEKENVKLTDEFIDTQAERNNEIKHHYQIKEVV